MLFESQMFRHVLHFVDWLSVYL